MSKSLNPKLLQEFLQKAGDTLHGDWLLVGGTLLPAVGLNVRSTVDIDLIGLDEKDNTQTLLLMEIADSLGLPIETPNQAAAFFLKKISYEKTDLLPLHKGKRGKIHRPSVSLYWKLKVARLSETDCIDCQHYFNYCKGQKDKINTEELNQVLSSALKQEVSKEKKERIKNLRDLL